MTRHTRTSRSGAACAREKRNARRGRMTMREGDEGQKKRGVESQEGTSGRWAKSMIANGMTVRCYRVGVVEAEKETRGGINGAQIEAK